MSKIRLLAVTPKPMVAESLPSYLLRLTTANGIRLPHRLYNRLRPLEPQRNRLGLRFGLNELRALTGWSESVLNDLGHECSMVGGVPIRTPKGAVKLDTDDVRPIRTPMHCPQCVEEQDFIDVSWCIQLVGICTRHRTIGVDSCAECGICLSWDRPALNRCVCGSSISSGVRISLSDERVACTDLIQHLVHPQLRSPVVAEQLGFPVDQLVQLDLKQLTRLFHDLALLHSHAENNIGQERLTPLECAGRVLRDWPKPFEEYLRRVIEKFPHDEAATYLFKREGSLLRRSRRQLGAAGGVFEFLTRPALAILDTSPVGLVVDRRVRTSLGKVQATSWAGVSQAAAATGMDTRAIVQLAAKGIIRSRPIGQGRIAVDIDEICGNVVSEWETVGDREAAAIIGISVNTFHACVKKGVFKFRLLQSASRGFPKAGVIQIRSGLDEAAAAAHVLDKPAGAIYTMGEIMKSSLFATRMKVDLLESLLQGRLQTIGRRRTKFLDLRVSGVAKLSPPPRAKKR